MWDAGDERRRRGYVKCGMDLLEDVRLFFDDVDSRNAIVVAVWIQSKCVIY